MRGPYQNSAALACFLAVHVDEGISAVDEVDVGETGTFEDRAVLHVHALVSVTGWIVHAQISLGFDYDARGDSFRAFMDEDATQEIYGDLVGIAVVEAGS